VAIDKNKIIEAATKFVQKGQYDKAIKEYARILELDPKDARIQQKLGELHQKKGDHERAAESFLKVAETYAADGFFLRAVAVYKQVLRLNPKLVDVNVRLAELHQQLGLMSDAMAQYQLVVNHHEKAGNIRASLEILRKMIDLDPDNIASRIKLAELYAREQMNQEASAEFRHAAEYLKRNNRIEDYTKVAERLLFLDAGDVSLARELASIYLSKQDTKRALAKLQLCFKADPRDVDTLSMLAQAFKDLGQLSKTVSVYKELAKIFGEQSKSDQEREIWKKVLELAPDDPDARARAGPAPKQARPAAPSAPAADKAGPEQVNKLLTETDVYTKYGLHEKALGHLKRVFALDPNSIEAHEKAAPLFNLVGNPAAAQDSLVQSVRICISKGDLERARTNLQKLVAAAPHHPQVLTLMSAVGKPAPAQDVPEADDGSILIEATAEEVEVAPEPAPHDLALETVARASGSAAPEEEPLVEPAADDGAALAAAAESAEPQSGDGGEPPEDIEEEIVFAEADGEEVVFSTVDEPQSQPVATAAREAKDPDSAPEEEPAGDELEEVTFFIEQGVCDEAREILDTLLLAFPKSKRVKELLARLEERQAASEGVQPSEEGFDLATELASEDFSEGSGAGAVPGGDFQYSVEEVLEGFKKGVQQAIKPEEYEAQYELGIAFKEMGLMDDAIAQFEKSMGSGEAKGKEVASLTMIGLCLMERGQTEEAIEAFTRGLHSSQASADATKALLFELGLAHQKAGRADLALEQFLAVEKVDPGFRDVKSIVARLRAGGAKPAAAPLPKAAISPEPAGPHHPKQTRKIGYV
jgi:tetratricopeptide (TPR) repeat protein